MRNDKLSEKHFAVTDVGLFMETVGASSSQTQSCKGCQHEDKLMEAGTKKNDNLKTKLSKERARVQGLQFGLLLSWFMLFSVMESKWVPSLVVLVMLWLCLLLSL